MQLNQRVSILHLWFTDAQVVFVFLTDRSEKATAEYSEKMVNTSHSDEEKGIQDKESKEESILAMLGIIGTILNLVVIIFVYIYTTL